MNPLYHLGIIRGVALANGKDLFPAEFWESLDAVQRELEIPFDQYRIDIKSPNIEQLDQLVKKAIDDDKKPVQNLNVSSEPVQKVDEIEYNMKTHPIKPYASIDGNGKIEVVILERRPDREDLGVKQAEIPEILPNGKKPRKPYPPRSEEQKAKLRDALAAARARKLAGAGPKDSEPDSPPPTGYQQAFSAPIRTTNAAQTDVTLTDNDWADIKRMRKNGLPDLRIASSLDVELEYLQRFTERMTSQERAQGNA